MTKRKGLISIIAVAVIAVIVMLAAGITLALSTSDNQSNGTLIAGGVELTATAKNLRVYSAVKASDTENAEVFYDEHGVAYCYQQSAVQSEDKIYFSSRTGYVSLKDKSVTIKNITPGDKVEFDVEVASESNVAFNYRAELYIDASEGHNLVNALNFSAGELSVHMNEALSLKLGTDSPVLYTDYKPFGVGQTTVEVVHVTISLPMTADDCQDEKVKFTYDAHGEQNTDVQYDVAKVGGETFETLAKAVEYARNHNLRDIEIIGSTALEEGTVTVDDAFHFYSDAKANPHPVIRGARIVVTDGASVSFDNVYFGGDSYIDVSNAMGLTLKDCHADVTPVKYFDAIACTYLEDSAFIVSGSSLTPVRLNITGTAIASGKGAAVSLRSPLASGTTISGKNVFGTDTRPYDGMAVLVFNGAEGTDPVITVSGNTFYGSRALMLGGKTTSTRYLVVSGDNNSYGLTDGTFVGGTTCAAFVDTGSKADGNALTCANVQSSTLMLGAVDVTLNSVNMVTGGKIAVSDKTNITEIYNYCLAGGSLENNAVSLYKDGVLYAYLNASDNEIGYVIDVIGSND